MTAQPQFIEQVERIVCQNLCRLFAFRRRQQHGQQAAYNPSFAIAKEVQRAVWRLGIAQPDAVFAAGDLARLRFKFVRQRWKLFPSQDQLAIFLFPL